MCIKNPDSPTTREDKQERAAHKAASHLPGGDHEEDYDAEDPTWNTSFALEGCFVFSPFMFVIVLCCFVVEWLNGNTIPLLHRTSTCESDSTSRHRRVLVHSFNHVLPLVDLHDCAGGNLGVAQFFQFDTSHEPTKEKW
jgi:hypothetical protein